MERITMQSYYLPDVTGYGSDNATGIYAITSCPPQHGRNASTMPLPVQTVPRNGRPGCMQRNHLLEILFLRQRLTGRRRRLREAPRHILAAPGPGLSSIIWKRNATIAMTRQHPRHCAHSGCITDDETCLLLRLFLVGKAD